MGGNELLAESRWSRMSLAQKKRLLSWMDRISTRETFWMPADSTTLEWKNLHELLRDFLRLMVTPRGFSLKTFNLLVGFGEAIMGFRMVEHQIPFKRR